MTEIPRDRWGRPLIVPPDGGKPVAYRRASSLGKALEDTSALARWQQRMVVTGLAARPDLIALAATANGDKKLLGDVADSALDAAASQSAANYGTALHTATEAHDLGRPITTLPDTMQRDLDAYITATEHLETKAAERFVVVDEVQVAGTFDRLYRLPDGRLVIGDLKTGSSAHDYPLAIAVQLAVYARGCLYTPAKGRVGSLPDLGVDQSVALLIHAPAGTGTCTVYELDIARGWELAELAARVLDVRRQARNLVAPAAS